MKKAKNIFLLAGICIYVLKTLVDIGIRIFYIFLGVPQLKHFVEILFLFFPIIIYMTLPTILLALNVKNKYKKSFSITVSICSAFSSVLVAFLFSPVLGNFIMFRLGLIDWIYLIGAFFPNYGIVSLISFILITIGSILSCKKS
ncbi:MAG: hypothetical protein IKJ93_01395 [Clostridia bacterium]|nr:hypothetical protein [Clostridia bacterium]